MSDKISVIVSISAVIGILLFISLFELPGSTHFWRELNNSGHAILFAGIALAFLSLSKSLRKSKTRSALGHYKNALVFSLGTGLISELAQVYTSRDADSYDFLLDALGVLSALLLRGSFDSSLATIRTAARTTLMRLGSILLLMLAFLNPFLWFVAEVQRDRAFPKLCSFETYWENKFTCPMRVDLKTVQPPVQWESADGKMVAKITASRRGYSGVEFIEPFPDWRGYSKLAFDTFSERNDTILFSIRIQDSQHNNEYNDRFNSVVFIFPGDKKHIIELDSVRFAPVNRELDMSSINSFMIFTANPKEPTTIYLDNLRLE